MKLHSHVPIGLSVLDDPEGIAEDASMSQEAHSSGRGADRREAVSPSLGG